MKILVPTDFSTASFNAFHLARKFANVAQAEIILLHVIEPPSASFSSMGESLEKDMEDVFMVKLSGKVEEELQSLKKAYHTYDIRIERDFGDPYTVINDLIQVEKVDMVIMGEKGIHEVDDLFIGSLTDKIVRTSRYPIITVNQTIEDQPIERVLYATDLQEEHPKLINLLKNIQHLFDAKLHIVKVNTRKSYSNDIDTDVAFRKLVDKYGLTDVETHTYNHEDEEDGIIFFADEINADLIAMGIHQKSGLRRLISGGELAEEVAEHSQRPVLTYHFSATRD
ncbi:MAG: universal stress protein [Cytophagales bacterium]|nr:universal stress protein [Cytophagales bacterium]